MANYFPVEFLGIFMTFYVTYKLKVQNIIISLLFHNQVIYLPLNNDDFKKLIDLNKEKKHNKGQGQIIIRSCTFKEFSEATPSKKFKDFDFLILIYFCNFVIYLFIYIQKIFQLLIVGKEKSPFLLEEKNVGDKSSNESSNFDFNFSIYLTLSFVIYIIYRELSSYVFSSGFLSKASKEFILCFFACFSIFFAIENYYEKLFNLNYESACKIINDRIDIILTKSKSNYTIELTKYHMKIFFSIIFSLISSIFLRSSERGAYFDNFFCNVSKTSQFNQNSQGYKQAYNTEYTSTKEIYLEYISKIKSIVNILIIAIILNPIFDNFLEVINLNSEIKKIIIIFILLNIDFILGFFILWYAYFMFSVENYQEILKFVYKPTQQYLPYHQRNVNYINEKAWDVLSHIFLNCFLPFYIFCCYLNEIDIFTKFKEAENNNNIEFNKGFVDNILYIVFLGILFTKGIIENIIFYFRLFTREKHLALF